MTLARASFGDLDARVDVSKLAPESEAHELAIALNVLLADLEEQSALVRRAQDALGRRERLAALGTLVGGVAHEVRTPLTYINNNVQTARTALSAGVARGEISPALHARVAPMLEEAAEGVDRVERIIRQLRGATRPHAPTRVLTSLDVPVREALELYRATHAGVATLLMDLKPTRAVLVDASEIQQVVLNLVDNAAEATAGKGSVRVRTLDGDGTAVLVVEDDGPGVPPELRARIFEPFVTTKPSGMGLGLSIVDRIVRAYGGSVALDTGPRGTAFTARFPFS